MPAARRSTGVAARAMCVEPDTPSPHVFGSVRDVRDAVEVQSRRALALAAAAGLDIPLERRPIADVVQEALGEG